MSSDVIVSNLAQGFAAPTREDWQALVEKALKGADFEKRLVTRSADGVRIEPLYSRRTEASLIAGQTAGRPWHMAARVDHPNPAAAAELALDDLMNGVDTLSLVFAGARSARGHGLLARSAAELDTALGGVDLSIITLRADPAPGGRLHAGLIAALYDRRGIKPQVCKVAFGLDPIGTLTLTGHLPAPWTQMQSRLAETIAALKARGFAGPFLTVDVRPYHEAGASEAQELAAALATGVAYLRALEAGGLSLEEARTALTFTVAVDADQMMGISKLRALRRLWAQVEEACGLAAAPARIEAETAWRMLTRRDPWVNMLRATMATFAAGIGGADSVSVLPYTLALGLPDGFARRIARNTQSILIEESNLWRVADPAAGSGAFEALTDELCRVGWQLFQGIEAEGGIVRCLEAGRLQSAITAVKAARDQQVATRKAPLTGTSEFPLLTEAPLKVLEARAVADADLPRLPADLVGAPFEDIVAAAAAGVGTEDTGHGSPGIDAKPLASYRLAESFEALRDISDRRLAETGERPKVFLASLGSIAEHTARSTWTRNTLAVGGIESVVPEGYDGAEAAAAAFRASGARIACICSSDERYAAIGAATAAALKAAGAREVLLAGRAGDLEQALRSAGVDGFLHAGQNAVETLSGLLERLA